MDPYRWSVWLHVVAACFWVGGNLFLALVVVPVVRAPRFAEDRALLIRRVGERFQHVGWIFLVLLALTGYLNLAYRGIDWARLGSATFWATPYGLALARKLAGFGVIVVLRFVHDLWLGPIASDAMADDPELTHASTRRLRRAVLWVGRLDLLLALLMVALAIPLVRG